MNIRVVALAVLKNHDGRILVEKGADTVKGEIFYRCIGGGVEFGEKASDALAREFHEELGQYIHVGNLLGVVENIFEWQGRPGHEIVMFYRCRFADEEPYGIEHLPRIDGVPDQTYWKYPSEILQEGALLHPAALIDLLENDKYEKN